MAPEALSRQPRLRRSVRRALLFGPAEGQQSDDVLAGERRVGAIGSIQPLQGAVQADGDVVIADPGRGLDIEHRVNAYRVGEGNIAALQMILGSRQLDVALGNVDAPQQDRPRGRAAQPQVDVACQFGQRGLYRQLRRGEDAHIQMQIIQRRIHYGYADG